MKKILVLTLFILLWQLSINASTTILYKDCETASDALPNAYTTWTRTVPDTGKHTQGHCSIYSQIVEDAWLLYNIPTQNMHCVRYVVLDCYIEPDGVADVYTIAAGFEKMGGSTGYPAIGGSTLATTVNAWHTVTIDVQNSVFFRPTMDSAVYDIFEVEGHSNADGHYAKYYFDNIRLVYGYSNTTTISAMVINSHYDNRMAYLVSNNRIGEGATWNIKSLQVKTTVSADGIIDTVLDNIDIPPCMWNLTYTNYNYKNDMNTPITGVYTTTGSIQLFLSDCTLVTVNVNGIKGTAVVTVNFYELSPTGGARLLIATNNIAVPWVINKNITSTNMYYLSTQSSGNMYLYDVYLQTTRNKLLFNRWQ